MTRRFLRVLLAGALPLLAACDDDAVSPDVGPSSLEVRAYVDADGSGAFDMGDDPIAGATIELTGPGAAASATTDAEGLATFSGLEPGSYRVTYAGEVPEGATLAGATSPVVVASILSEEIQSEFRFVQYPGSISGVLFRDENGNGAFDEGDLPAPGIPVTVHAGASTEGEPVAETTTDETGAFQIDGLRPGTYTLTFAPFPTMQLDGGVTQTVEVGADATTAYPVEFTGNLLSPVSDARTLALADSDEVVAVEGVVSWQPDFNRDLYIQDSSGGIMVYGGGAGVDTLGLVPGDTVIVVGPASLYFGEPQIGATNILPQGSGPAPEGAATTAQAINAGDVQHQLVTIAGATVVKDSVLSYGNQYVTLTDPAGNEFAVYADSRTGVVETMWSVGGVYEVTGVVAYDNRYPYPHRVEVRSPADVVPADPVSTIAEVKAAETGVEMSVEGTVIWQPSYSDELWIQDETGGLQVYGAAVDASSYGLEPGDVVRVTGTTEDRFGERQLTSVSYLAVVGTGPAPAPAAITPAEVGAPLVHQLVTIQNATVVEVDDTTLSFGNQLVTLEVAGAQFGVYVDSRTGVSAGDWTVGSVYDVTGVINYDSRYPPAHRIWVRGPADVVAN